MVIDKYKYHSFLKNPDSLVYEDSIYLDKIIHKYPYFQSAIVIYLKLLKNNNISHKSMLYKAAAYTTDRSVLFRYMENIVSFSEQEQKKEKTNINYKPNTIQTKTLKNEEVSELQETTVLTKKLTYSEWMIYLSQVGGKTNKKQKDSIFDLIDKFLRDKPKIIPKRDKIISTPENVIKSVEEKQMLMTETLADLYVKQKKYDKAIKAFKILSLKYPKKSSYFAKRIIEVKILKK